MDRTFTLHYDFGDDDHVEEFDFEIPYDDYRAAIYEEISNITGVDPACVEALDNEEFLCDIDEMADLIEDELKVKYYDEAYEAYKDAKEYERDPYAYYGVSRSDF